jgi:hypothetical protein
MIKAVFMRCILPVSSPDLLECWEVSTNTTEADTVHFQCNNRLYQVYSLYHSTLVLSTTKAAEASEALISQG